MAEDLSSCFISVLMLLDGPIPLTDTQTNSVQIGDQAAQIFNCVIQCAAGRRRGGDLSGQGRRRTPATETIGSLACSR